MRACYPLCMLSHLSCLQLCATLGTVARQPPLSMKVSGQEYWSGLPFPLPGDLPKPGIQPRSPALQAISLPSESPRKPIEWLGWGYFNACGRWSPLYCVVFKQIWTKMRTGPLASEAVWEQKGKVLWWEKLNVLHFSESAGAQRAE